MGMYLSVTVGVYLEFPIVNETTTRIVLKSPVTGKEFSDGTKFCPQSGKPLVEKTITETEIRDIDVWELDDDSLNNGTFCPINETCNLFELNVSDKEIPHLHHSVDKYKETQVIDLLDLNPKELVEKFKIKYKPYLDYFEKKYGDFEVKYGMYSQFV